MSQELAINSYDIVSTLQALGMMKYWKGKHIILKKQVTHFIWFRGSANTKFMSYPRALGPTPSARSMSFRVCVSVHYCNIRSLFKHDIIARRFIREICNRNFFSSECMFSMYNMCIIVYSLYIYTRICTNYLIFRIARYMYIYTVGSYI